MAEFVEAKQASMSFEGEDPENPLQIEADEGAFGLEDPGEKEPGTAVAFNEYVGLMARDQPDSLYLEKRDPGHCEATRAESGRACPPQYTAQEWVSLRTGAGSSRDKPLMGENVLLHTDGSRCYANVDADANQMHDSVIHSYRGDGPEYVASRQHELPSGDILQAKAETCSMDGWWKWGKQAVQQVNRTNPAAMHRKIRVQQWHTWCRGEGRWMKASEVLSILFRN